MHGGLEPNLLSVYVAISYAEGYPTTEGGVIKGLVNRPEGIAENSTIACAVSNCPSCDPFESFSCKLQLQSNSLNRNPVNWNFRK